MAVDELEAEVVFDPGEHNVAEVLDHVAANPDDRESVLAAEVDGRARKTLLEALDVGELGPLSATTALREDFAGRDLVAPGVDALDYLGRATTSTVDFLGRALRRTLRVNATAYALGAELQFTGGEKFVVKTAGTTAAAPPTVPAVGADVTDGTAVLTRQK